MVIVASTSITNVASSCGAQPAAHTFSRAADLAFFTPARCSASIRLSINRQMVVTEATGPCWAF